MVEGRLHRLPFPSFPSSDEVVHYGKGRGDPTAFRYRHTFRLAATMKRSCPDTPKPAHVAVPRAGLASGEAALKENTCSACNGALANISLPKCGHMFHTRCISQYPVKSCQSCRTESSKVALVYPINNEQPPLRNGKWTPEEELYVQCIIKEFLAGSLPVGQGTPVRLVLARLLNCSPMRLSKKFQRKALGKHTYNIPKSKTVEFAEEQHRDKMKILAKLEANFYQQIVLAKKAEMKPDDDKDELKALLDAATTFWSTQFVKFAMKIGQSVVGYDLPPAKKIRRNKRPHLLDIPSNGFSLGEDSQRSSMSSSSSSGTPTHPANHSAPKASPVNTPSGAFSALSIAESNDEESSGASLLHDPTIDPFLSNAVNLVDQLWLRSLDNCSSSEPSSPQAVDQTQDMYANASALFNDLDLFLFDPVDDPIAFIPRGFSDSVSIDF